LFGGAFEDVDDFFATRMGMEPVRLAGFERGAYEKDIACPDDFRIGHPFHVAPRQIRVLNVLGSNKMRRHGAHDNARWLRGEHEADLERPV
jgi:hypothetical protein